MVAAGSLVATRATVVVTEGAFAVWHYCHYKVVKQTAALLQRRRSDKMRETRTCLFAIVPTRAASLLPPNLTH